MHDKPKSNNRMFFHAAAFAALSFMLGACSNTASTVQISTPPPLVGKQITGDTLRRTLSGTVPNTYPAGTPKAGQAHTLYYMDSSVAIPAGDTLLIQPGITIIVLNTNADGSPEFQVFGTLISYGTQSQPIYMTVQPNLRQYNLLQTGLWGGIQCAAPKNALAPSGSGDLILHWTHIEFAGGSSGPNDPIVASKKTRYAVYFQNANSNFIMEDSWITGSVDDPIRVAGGKISFFRNVWECGSTNSGDGLNIKAGTVGDIAYNVFIGNCTNGPKLANLGTANPPLNVNIYNNTIGIL